jgi:ribosomal protein L29
MNDDFQKLSASDLSKFLIEEIKRFNTKLETGRPLRELKETRKHIQRIYTLLEEHEKIELKDIFGNSFLQILMRDG